MGMSADVYDILNYEEVMYDLYLNLCFDHHEDQPWGIFGASFHTCSMSYSCLIDGLELTVVLPPCHR